MDTDKPPKGMHLNSRPSRGRPLTVRLQSTESVTLTSSGIHLGPIELNSRSISRPGIRGPPGVRFGPRFTKLPGPRPSRFKNSQICLGRTGIGKN